jgi:hypothetical protein
MIRSFSASTLAFGFLVLGCTSADTGTGAAGVGGAGGAGGSFATGGAGGTQTGGGDSAETGGGDGGSAGDASTDASLTHDATGGDSDGETTDDASPVDGRAIDGNPGGTTLTGRPWNYICEKSWSHEQCCAFLCTCLAEECADSPMDKPGIDNCMTNCPKLSDMAMRCHVFHCYESTNPTNPKDHISHCGHASGRVAGGNCPTEVYK